MPQTQRYGGLARNPISCGSKGVLNYNILPLISCVQLLVCRANIIIQLLDNVVGAIVF